MTADLLAEILEKGDTDRCFEFFKGMPETIRRQYFSQVKAFWTKVHRNQWQEETPGHFLVNRSLPAAEAAYLATATFAEIKKAKRSGRPNDDGLTFSILVDRAPDWIDEWVETLLSESYYWAHWRLIRRLMAAGLAKKPNSPKYFLGMIGALGSRFDQVPLTESLQESPDLLAEDIWKLFEYDGEGDNSLANCEQFGQKWSEPLVALSQAGKLSRTKLLQSSIEALERDFNHYRARWFFEFYDRLEPTIEEEKAHADHYLGLLRASAPNVVTWALERVERHAKSGSYDVGKLVHGIAPLLQARVKGTALRAIELLGLQLVAAPDRTTETASIVATALGHEAADVQNAALGLLERISSTNDDSVRAVAMKYVGSVAASVKARLAKWLSASVPATGSAQARAADVVQTTSKPGKSRREKTKGEDKSSKSAAENVVALPRELRSLFAIDVLCLNLEEGKCEIPAAVFDGTDIPRLAVLSPLTPIDDFEELIDVCARVIEDGLQVDDVERCIDGLARLCGSKPSDLDRIAAPLLKRVRQLIRKGAAPFLGLDPANDLLGLVYAFCTRNVIEPTCTPKGCTFQFEGETLSSYSLNMRKPIGFLSRRCQDVARRLAAGTACQLLSIPTFEQGWISAAELAKRVNAWRGLAPDTSDVVLAMLRLAPDGRTQALKQIKPRSDEWSQSIRYALGADKVNVGDDSALWVAACRSRSPWQADEQVIKKFPNLGPDAGQAATLQLRFKRRKSYSFTFVDTLVDSVPACPRSTNAGLVTVTMHACRSLGEELTFELGGFGGKTDGAIRWTASIFPCARESFFAGAIRDCFNNLDWSEAQWQNRTMLEPLLDSGTPLRYTGLNLLVGMLSAKEPGEAGLAADVAIRAIEDGRLGSDNLGRAMAELIRSGLIKPGRWQKTLADVARSSSVHGAVIQNALQQCLVGTAQEAPKDISKLLELLLELSMELGLPLSSESCRTYLAKTFVSGKAGKLAKELLNLEVNEDTKSKICEVLSTAIEQRLRAAQRFNPATS